MTQGILPIKYESEPTASDITAYAGLPLYLDLFAAIGLNKVIDTEVKVREGSQGWSDSQLLTSLILLNLAGGDSVDDLNVLETDPGLHRVIRHVAFQGLNRLERREMELRWRKDRQRALPSASAVFRYLEKFHDAEEETKRLPKTAFIPAAKPGLRGLYAVNRYLQAVSQRQAPVSKATLDIDATLNESHKLEALWCYKGYPAYQPLTVYWLEQDLILHSEFRDGNVNAGFELRRVLEESLRYLPRDVRKVYLRSDTAGYQWEVLKYCAKRELHPDYGVIEFAVGVDVTPEFKKAVAEVSETSWNRLARSKGDPGETGQEWAEVCFVPNAISKSKKGPEYRFIAVRERLSEQLSLPGVLEDKQLQLPFPTMEFGPPTDVSRYKITGVVTNRDLAADELVWWYRQRCGKSEEVHGVMKTEFAGGRLPSGLFGANAAWWAVVVLAYNLQSMMKRFGLDQTWHSKRPKAIRFGLINRPGRIIERARSFYIRVHASVLKLFLSVREKILGMTPLVLTN
jgi:hypothetical protein